MAMPKGFMVKILSLMIISFLVSCNVLFAKDVSLEVLAKKAEVVADMNEEQILLLNGFHQIVTRELEELKMDSALYWSKLEKKKMSLKEEFIFLQKNFSGEIVIKTVIIAPKSDDKNNFVSGLFTGSINIETLKTQFAEVMTPVDDAKLKTFYVVTNFDMDEKIINEDIGSNNLDNFLTVILDSWKKLIAKEIKGFDRVVFLEKDFLIKPDNINMKSVTLKWKSNFKKTDKSSNMEGNYVLNAQYILQNTKSDTMLLAFDFPEQKKIFDDKNKKDLNSHLASLIYNLLLSQVTKMERLLESEASIAELSEVEIKIVGKTGLSEMNQISNLLQEKFKDLKLTSQIKSYAMDSASIIIRAQAAEEKILNGFSSEPEGFSLNEQKVLLFDRAHKTFAILPKKTNN